MSEVAQREQDEQKLAASIERKMGNVLESMRSRERSSNAGTASERYSHRVSTHSLGEASRSPKIPCSPRTTPKQTSSLSEEEAKALAESIDRKMDNVLQSMRSRKALSPQGSQCLEAKGANKIGSEASAGSTSVAKEEEKDATDMQMSADDFETFSSADEDENVQGGGMPVDSMANFVPVAADNSRERSVLRKERGNLAGSRATTKSSDKRKEEQADEPGRPDETNHRIGVGRLMKKLTGGRKLRVALLSPRKSGQE